MQLLLGGSYAAITRSACCTVAPAFIALPDFSPPLLSFTTMRLITCHATGTSRVGYFIKAFMALPRDLKIIHALKISRLTIENCLKEQKMRSRRGKGLRVF